MRSVFIFHHHHRRHSTPCPGSISPVAAVLLDRGYVPPRVFDRLPVRRLLLLETLEQVVDHSAHFRDVAVEGGRGGIFAQASLEHRTELVGDVEKIAVGQSQVSFLEIRLCM